jgi:hypothetical protein
MDGDPHLEIDAALDRAEHVVARAEDALEQVELLVEQLEDALVGLVLPVEEVHDEDVGLLAVAVAAADALLDALRVPRQVVVDDDGAELEVHALGRRLGGQQQRAALAELIDDGRLHVGALRARGHVFPAVPLRAFHSA